MKRFAVSILITLMLFCSFNGLSQTKIDKSKDELKKGSSDNKDNSTSKTSTSSSDSESSDGFFAEIAARIFVYVTYYSFIGNYELEEHLYNDISNYPFYKGGAGNYIAYDSLSNDYKKFRLDIDNDLLLRNDNLFGNHLKAKIRPSKYLYFQTDYFQLFEYDRLSKSYSNLSLFNFALCYDRLRFQRFNLGWVLGVNYVANDVQKAGLSFGLNTDIFFPRNVSLYSSIKFSSINGVPVNEFEVKLKHHHNRFFYSIGYEYLKIGSPNYHFATIGGGVYF